MVLAGEGADHADAGEVFLDDAGERALGLVHGFEDVAHAAEIEVTVGDERADEGEGDEGERCVEREQERQGGGGEQGRLADLHDLHGEELARGLDVAGAALHEVAGVGAVEVARGQVVEVVVEVVFQPARDAVARERDLPALQVAEHAGEGGERDHGDGREPEVCAEVVGAAEQAEQGGEEGRGGGVGGFAGDGVVEGDAADQRHGVAEQDGEEQAAEGESVAQALAAQEAPEDGVGGGHRKRAEGGKAEGGDLKQGLRAEA